MFRISSKIKTIIIAISLAAVVLIAAAMPVFAWFYVQRDLAAYAPVASPEALYIGAGHCEQDNGTGRITSFEDIRYLYFDAMDIKDDAEGDGKHWDAVFCVYGKMVSGYRIQLAFTTNNQFTYELYNATESQVESEDAVEYTTHGDVPGTYYYSIDGDAIGGRFLNKAVDAEILADDTKHDDTYGYGHVHKYAEPIYWQTVSIQNGNSRGSFVNYYILRIRSAGNIELNRETDIIGIAAKSFSI